MPTKGCPCATQVPHVDTAPDIGRRLRDSNPFLLSHVWWHVPRAMHGRLRFVRSADAAGNTSPLRWARLLVR